MSEAETTPLPPRHDPGVPPEQAAREFYERIRTRRSVREFSDRPVSRETIEWLVRCATTAPSGANLQPWHFVCIHDPETKRAIRVAAEKEEREFYENRAPQEWLDALAPLGTDSSKPFLEVAPWLVVLFRRSTAPDGGKLYYTVESAGLAAGLFLAAAHHAGLVTLTHTPSPMGFLSEILGRPANEKPFLLLPVGYPADDCRVPTAALERKSLDEVMDVRE